MNRSQACQCINDAMEAWQMPLRIKIDNGLPFVFPKARDIPTLSQLWWIGLGIEVQLNTPNTPQQNGTVEGLQGICKRWSSPGLYQTLEAYQQRVDEVNRVQRETYRMRKNRDQTRRQLYPELWQNKRTYSPSAFSMERIYRHLAGKVWVRTVKKCGRTKFWARNIYVGKRFALQKITITMDFDETKWMIRDTEGRLLKVYERHLFTKAQILAHAGISKN